MKTVLLKQPIGLRDRDGVEIREGDIVEFWVSYDEAETAEYSLEKHPNPSEFTHMVDKVVEHGGKYYFWNTDVDSGGLARRHSSYCKIIGNIHEIATQGAKSTGEKRPRPHD